MRLRIVSLLALLLLLLPAAGLRAQAFRSIFDRLGDTVDAYEREYFGFFPALEGFSSATLLAEGDSLRFVVHRSSGAADSSIGLSHREAVLLDRLVDGYESILQQYSAAVDDQCDDPDSRELELRFGLLLRRGALRLHREIVNDAPRVMLHLREGGTATGIMLFFTDSVLALGSSDVPFYWRSADSGVVVYPYRSIARIARRGGGSFHRGAGTGFLLGTCFMALMWSNTMEGKHNTGQAPLVTDPGALLALGFITGGLPGLFIGGCIGLIPSWNVNWQGTELPMVWQRDTAVADSFFVYTHRLPLEWQSRFRIDVRAPRTPVLPAVDSGTPPLSDSGRATERSPAPIQITGRVDFAIHYYGLSERTSGVSFGAGIAAELPLLRGRDSMPLLSLRPCIGAGAQYGFVDLNLVSPRLGIVYLLGGICWKSIREEFGQYCNGIQTAIVQQDFADHLFAGGGIGIDRGRSILELQLRTSLRRIVMPISGSYHNFCPVPAPVGITSIQLTWGWKW